MAMNREQKRAMQRAGQLGPDGEAATTTRQRRAPRPVTSEERTKPAEFMREVRAEMRKVTWPTREETVRFSIIVGVAIVAIAAFIFGADLVFGAFNGFLFPKSSASAPAAIAALLL